MSEVHAASLNISQMKMIGVSEINPLFETLLLTTLFKKCVIICIRHLMFYVIKRREINMKM
jgi:uncharacterized membrane protein